ncbi:MAG: hypothetical protein HOP11_15250 [Saprospiraceae bacterium]|nr:hypothetical protein [Saprospiraceae bacterium]
MKKIFYFLAIMICVGLADVKAQEAFLGVNGILVLQSGPVQNSYTMDIPNPNQSSLQMEKTYEKIWNRWKYIHHSVDMNTKKITFVLDRSSNRNSWTNEDWNDYISKAR